MAKFTSGKWDVSESRGTYYIGDTNRDICGVWTKNPYDARLIAAAPDMYEILRGLYEFKLEFSPETRNRIGELLRAIDDEQEGANV